MRLTFWRAESVARCPDCDSSHLSRLATVCESRFDGVGERAVPVGGRYACNGCGLQFESLRDGPHRLKPAKVKVEPEAAAGRPLPTDEKPRKPPGRDVPIPIRLPPAR